MRSRRSIFWRESDRTTSRRIAAAVLVVMLMVVTWSSCCSLLPKGTVGRTIGLAPRSWATAAAAAATSVASMTSVPCGR